MSNIIKGILSEASYPEDPEAYRNMFGARRNKTSDMDAPEPRDPWTDVHDRESRALAQYKKDVATKTIDKEGVAPNGKKYNTVLVIKSKSASQGDNEVYKFNDLHWGAKNIVDTVKKEPTEQGAPFTTIVYYVDNHKYGTWKPWKPAAEPTQGELFAEEIMREGMDYRQIADGLLHALEVKYPDIVSLNGHEVIGSAVLRIAKEFEGIEHLDSGVMKVMMKKVMNLLSSVDAEVTEEQGPCWSGYQQIGMKEKGGRKVPNCVPVRKESSIMKGLVDENLGTPYPETYEQEVAPLRRKGSERTMSLTFEDDK